MENKRKAIVFARVSTKDQQEFGHSLPAQTAVLKAYAEKHGFEVIREFSFSESAGLKIRKKFEEMMDFLKKHTKETMPVVLTHNVDRLTRNFRDMLDIDEMRLRQGLAIHFVQDGFIMDAQATGGQLFMWEAKVFLAKQYLNRLTEDAKRSMKYKLENGEWNSLAPIGYINVKDENGRSTIRLDEERCMLVHRMFLEYASGLHSIGEITRMITSWGLRNKTKRRSKLSVSQVHTILQNPFYYGVMEFCGQPYPHKYPTLIDKATYDRCQAVRLGWKKKPFKYSEKPFVLRGLVQCGHCGCAYSSEIKKNKYVYLSCTKNRDPNCPAPRVKEEAVFEQLVGVFDQMAFPEEIMEDIRGHIEKVHKSKAAFHETSLLNLQKEYNSIQRQLDVLLDAMLKECITPNDYDKKARELKEQQQELKEQLTTYESADEIFATSVKLLLELVNNAGTLFRRANVEEKRQLINLVCQNLQLTDGKVQFSLRKPFELFLLEPKHQEWLGC